MVGPNRSLESASLHPWRLTPSRALEVQAELRRELHLEWTPQPIATVAGIDVGFSGSEARAAIVVMSFPELIPLESVTAELPVTFPYIPGLLAFREGPVVLNAWERLQTVPDLLLFDAQGIAHPRGIGLASHLGLWLRRPSIGAAKSRLYGHYAEPGPNKGDWAPLKHETHPHRVLGAVLRTRDRVRPIFVSPGHQIDVRQSVALTLACCPQYRIPEPTRWAHKVATGATRLSDARSQNRRS